MSTSSGKPSPMSWKNFLMKAEIEEEEASEGGKWILSTIFLRTLIG